MGTIGRRRARLLSTRFCTIFVQKRGAQIKLHVGCLKCFQTPHTPHFCWPLTKTSNQDFHDACWRTRPAPVLVDITYTGTRMQRLLLIILPLHWGYLYSAVQAFVGCTPLLKPKCKYTRSEAETESFKCTLFFCRIVVQCLNEHSGCKHTFCLDFNGSQIFKDKTCSVKQPKCKAADFQLI